MSELKAGNRVQYLTLLRRPRMRDKSLLEELEYRIDELGQIAQNEYDDGAYIAFLVVVSLLEARIAAIEKLRDGSVERDEALNQVLVLLRGKP